MEDRRIPRFLVGAEHSSLAGDVDSPTTRQSGEGVLKEPWVIEQRKFVAKPVDLDDVEVLLKFQACQGCRRKYGFLPRGRQLGEGRGVQIGVLAYVLSKGDRREVEIGGYRGLVHP